MSGKVSYRDRGDVCACVREGLCESLSHPVPLDVWFLSLITSVRKMSHLGECTCCPGLWVPCTDGRYPQKVFTTYLFSLFFHTPTLP